MDKFYDKQLAADVGHEAALEIALAGSELVAEVEAMNAIRGSQGRPSLKEQENATLEGSARFAPYEAVAEYLDRMSKQARQKAA